MVQSCRIDLDILPNPENSVPNKVSWNTIHLKLFGISVPSQLFGNSVRTKLFGNSVLTKYTLFNPADRSPVHISFLFPTFLIEWDSQPALETILNIQKSPACLHKKTSMQTRGRPVAFGIIWRKKIVATVEALLIL